MQRKARTLALGVTLLVAVGVVYLVAAGRAEKGDPKPAVQADRPKLMKAYNDGNYKDAYDGLRQLALDPQCDPAKVSEDLNHGIACLQQLGRVDEIDEFREGVVKAHAKNWRLLETAAVSYQNTPHHGFIVAGQFYRGDKRGGGRFVNAFPRDRVRALQLMQDALGQTKAETNKKELAQFHLRFAQWYGNNGLAWRLQYLTDLSVLPDYEDGDYWHRDGSHRGAPVDAKGNPVLHQIPKSYADAGSDGERWRFLMAQAVELDATLANQVDMTFAQFLHQQFGTQTMAWFGWHRGGDDDNKDESGTYALHTLKDDETIARLATGVKRFSLPDDFNYLKLYQRIAARGKNNYGEQARDAIVQVYLNRRQYPKAAEAIRVAIKEYGKGHDSQREKQLEQIVGNWGRFESVAVQPAGKLSVIDFRFRNGTKVDFEAHEIKVGKLLDDVKAYLKANPGQIDWEKTNIGDIGHRLVEKGQNQYLGKKVAEWGLDLKPRPEHFDKRMTVTTPLIQPGAYLVVGKMKDGNISRVIVWVNDTVIAKKNLDGQTLYFIADALTGEPIEKADVEFFGWKQEHLGNNKWRVDTTGFDEKSDKDGLLRLDGAKQLERYQWLITAKTGKEGQGRFAHLGFSNVWSGKQYDQTYEQTRVFSITDRPVYRPNQKVNYKFWVRHSKYDEPDVSDYANQNFTVEISNPKGERILTRAAQSDEYAGVSGDYALPAGAMLGMYHIHIYDGARQKVSGGIGFRVEEYKKPEFEVKVEAPKEPVRLGETVIASINAKYYFGAPVTRGKVKYKVERTKHNSHWYPRGDWDWFYGPGYWWFAGDYLWYPGFAEWGCCKPTPWWWHRHDFQPPELVMENEIAIGEDGTIKVAIDTMPAKEMHGDSDHQYTITAEVVDESRRTIVGTGKVLVSRKPFQVTSWLDKGHYRAGDTMQANFNAHTLDHKAVEGKGVLTLYRISYDPKGKPTEKAVETWDLNTNAEGVARQQLVAAEAGQYRLSYKLTDSKKHTIEGGSVFLVRGKDFDGRDFRFNDLELTTDRREYQPGDKVKLLVNTNRQGATVLLFVRPTNGVCLAPKVLRLQGKALEEEIAVVQKDMPNFFVEALTISNGRIHGEMREVAVPPEKRVVNVEVLPSQKEYKPGAKANIKVKLTDLAGKPFVGSTAVTFYDRSVEYISGGSNIVPDIKEYFWKWRRHHNPSTESNVTWQFGNLLKQRETGMHNLGIFGDMVQFEMDDENGARLGFDGGPPRDNAPRAPGAGKDMEKNKADAKAEQGGQGEPAAGDTGGVRKNFADTAFWSATLNTNKDGIAEINMTMPENLTGWKLRVWAMGHGTKVGQGEAEVTTKKDLLIRMQAPRFFVQKDEVVLSANVHNYLASEKEVTVTLDVNDKLQALDKVVRTIRIPAGGEQRVDWRVKVLDEGQAVVRMKAVCDVESDAMEQKFPAYVHGMLKTDSFSGVIRPDQDSGKVTLNVPAERRINETKLEVRYSPTLAGAMVDALPYMVEYPYGCTEQTLNRFLPTVITQRILQKMNLNLKDIEEKRTNLNAQEIGDPKARAKQWKRFDRNPVFNEAEVKAMSDSGIARLATMQCSDGGWGWFSGNGERSYPHTTAVVVHGLQIARDAGVAMPQGMLERGIDWLKRYQNEEAKLIKLCRELEKKDPKEQRRHLHRWKTKADHLDAMVYMILGDSGNFHKEMCDYLYEDRNGLAVYAKAMFGLGLAKEGKEQADKLAMILKNISQYVVQDDENQTAYLKLPGENYWWNWYGSEIESNAYYLKLLSRTDPQNKTASRLVKYLLNNRKNSTYWTNTRDSAICIEAMADHMKASGEDKPDMTVEVWLDGKKHKEVKIDNTNLFTFDGTLVLFGDAVESGKHTLEIKRKGTGPVYFNAYLTNFTLEDFITKAGLEVKVQRKYYKLTRDDKDIKVSGARGQALDQRVERWKRTELASGAELKSGDLVEVELEIDSKNDYEYLMFEDPKAAGFEPMQLQSGYTPNGMGAYMELRDEKVTFFVRSLARGKHSLSYRLRAEIPGKFSALPTRAEAMYAPELKGNSDEIKLGIKD